MDREGLDRNRIVDRWIVAGLTASIPLSTEVLANFYILFMKLHILLLTAALFDQVTSKPENEMIATAGYVNVVKTQLPA